MIGPTEMFVQPFLGHGFSPSGLYLAMDERLYPVLARVLAVGEAVTRCAPSEVVVYLPGSYDWVHLEEERSFATMREESVMAKIANFESFDQRVEPCANFVVLDPIDENTEAQFHLVRHRDVPNAATEGNVIAHGPSCKYVAPNTRVAYVGKKALVLSVGGTDVQLISEKYILATVEDAA